jgi:hypothetical protein
MTSYQERYSARVMSHGAEMPAAPPGAGAVQRSVRLCPVEAPVARGPLGVWASTRGMKGVAPAESCVPAGAGMMASGVAHAEAGSRPAVGGTGPAFARASQFSLASLHSRPVDESRRFPCPSRRSWPRRSRCGELESSWMSFPSWHRPWGLGFLGSWCSRETDKTLF